MSGKKSKQMVRAKASRKGLEMQDLETSICSAISLLDLFGQRLAQEEESAEHDLSNQLVIGLLHLNQQTMLKLKKDYYAAHKVFRILGDHQGYFICGRKL